MAKEEKQRTVGKELTAEEWEKSCRSLAKTEKKLDAIKEQHKLERRTMREKENDLKSEIQVLAEQVDTREKQVPAQRDMLDDREP